MNSVTTIFPMMLLLSLRARSFRPLLPQRRTEGGEIDTAGDLRPMATSRPMRGRNLRLDAPEWEPLLNLAPDHVVDFMWMGAIQLTDGTRIQAYKHCWT